MRYAYPYVATPEKIGFSIHFPDVPEAHSASETAAELDGMATDCLVTALSFYVEDGQPLPRPSPARGRRVAYVPTLEAAKLALHARKLELGLSDAALATRLGLDQKSVSRLLDPLHRSHIRFVDAALVTLGRRLEVAVREIA